MRSTLSSNVLHVRSLDHSRGSLLPYRRKGRVQESLIFLGVGRWPRTTVRSHSTVYLQDHCCAYDRTMRFCSFLDPNSGCGFRAFISFVAVIQRTFSNLILKITDALQRYFLSLNRHDRVHGRAGEFYKCMIVELEFPSGLSSMHRASESPFFSSNTSAYHRHISH